MTVIAYFGEPWGPVTDDATQRATPVGEPCLWCEEAIVAGDQGTWTPTIDRYFATRVRPQHRECQLRSVLGCVAHLERRCTCWGGTDHHEEGATYREEALAVWMWIELNGASSI